MLMFPCSVPLLVCVLLGVVHSNTTLRPEKTIKTYIGYTITLDCKAPTDTATGDIIVWYYERESIRLTANQLPSTTDTARFKRLDVTGEAPFYNLVIKDLMYIDQGVYHCRIYRGGSESQFETILTRELIVTEDVSTTSEDEKDDESDTATLDVFAVLGLLSGVFLLIGIVGAIAWKYGRKHGRNLNVKDEEAL